MHTAYEASSSGGSKVSGDQTSAIALYVSRRMSGMAAVRQAGVAMVLASCEGEEGEELQLSTMGVLLEWELFLLLLSTHGSGEEKFQPGGKRKRAKRAIGSPQKRGREEERKERKEERRESPPHS